VAKRKAKKGRKRARSGNPQAPATRTLDLGPITLTQEGAYIGIRSNPEHPDYEAFRTAQREAADNLPQYLLELRRKLAELTAPHHAFDVVFGVWGTYGRVRASTLKPLADDSLTATAEFVAHILLDRSGPEPTRTATDEETRRGVNPEEVGELVAQLVGQLPILFTHREVGEQGELDPWTELRARLYMHRLAVRSFTYEQQETETLRSLFSPFDAELANAPGFTVEQALGFARAVGELPMMRAGERAGRARSEAETLRRVVAARRQGKPAKTEYPEHIIEQLVQLPPKLSEEWIEGLTASWAWHGYGRDAAFTAGALAAHVGADVPSAQAFLDRFSVEFGKRKDAKRWEENPERALGGEMEVMRANPILHDGQGLYLPCALDSLFYGLRDQLTDALKADGKTWERFQAHRARHLEGRALAALRDVLSADWAHGSVKYAWIDENRVEQQGEADGILRADSLVILIETKAGALAPSARRAAPDRLERGLRDLIEAAAHQLSRDEHTLVEGKAMRITDSAGKPLALDIDGVVRVLRIAVTLEDLAGVAPAAWRLQEAGLLPANEQVPWVVGIHELELICRLTERPGQLVHYILRRQRANRQRIWGMDEMDFFMRYLHSGLFWHDEDLEGTFLELQSHTEPLDEWWYAEHGIRKPAKKPRQHLNQATRRLLGDIEATGMLGRTEAQVMVLEMAQRERERVASGLRELSRKTKRDGQPHDMTFIFQEDFGVTLHSNPAEMRQMAGDRLTDHGVKRTENSNLRRWLGLANTAGSRHRIEAMAIIVNPERLTDEEPDRKPHAALLEDAGHAEVTATEAAAASE
jgi:hypothetical protein